MYICSYIHIFRRHAGPVDQDRDATGRSQEARPGRSEPAAQQARSPETGPGPRKDPGHERDQSPAGQAAPIRRPAADHRARADQETGSRSGPAESPRGPEQDQDRRQHNHPRQIRTHPGENPEADQDPTPAASPSRSDQTPSEARPADQKAAPKDIRPADQTSPPEDRRQPIRPQPKTTPAADQTGDRNQTRKQIRPSSRDEPGSRPGTPEALTDSKRARGRQRHRLPAEAQAGNHHGEGNQDQRPRKPPRHIILL